MPTQTEQSLNNELSVAFKQMHALNVSIAAERQRNNVAGVQALLPLFKLWFDKYKSISAQLGRVEFTDFDRFLLSTQKYVDDAINAVPGAVAAIPAAVLKGLWPFALAGVAWLFIRGKL